MRKDVKSKLLKLTQLVLLNTKIVVNKEKLYVPDSVLKDPRHLEAWTLNFIVN